MIIPTKGRTSIAASSSTVWTEEEPLLWASVSSVNWESVLFWFTPIGLMPPTVWVSAVLVVLVV